jgi:hypothetical protein
MINPPMNSPRENVGGLYRFDKIRLARAGLIFTLFEMSQEP